MTTIAEKSEEKCNGLRRYSPEHRQAMLDMRDSAVEKFSRNNGRELVFVFSDRSKVIVTKDGAVLVRT